MQFRKFAAVAAAPLVLAMSTAPALAEEPPVMSGWVWATSDGSTYGACGDGYRPIWSIIPNAGTFTVDFEDGTTRTDVTQAEAEAILAAGTQLRGDTRSVRYNFDAGPEDVPNGNPAGLTDPPAGVMSEGDCVLDGYEIPGGENPGGHVPGTITPVEPEPEPEPEPSDGGGEPVEPARPEQPEPVVTVTEEHTDWTRVDDPECDDTTVEETRETTTTTTTTPHVWDDEAGEWVPGDPEVTTETTTETRTVTLEDVEKCESPEPEPTEEPVAPAPSDGDPEEEAPAEPTTPAVPDDESPAEESPEPAEEGVAATTPTTTPTPEATTASSEGYKVNTGGETTSPRWGVIAGLIGGGALTVALSIYLQRRNR